jgi:CBS domain-containing protein
MVATRTVQDDATIRVSELMTGPPVQVSGDTSIESCAVRMAHLGIRHLPVVRSDGSLYGVVTDAAVRRRLTTFAGMSMAADLATVAEVVAGPNDVLASVMRRLVRTRQDFVVVVDEHRHPLGMLTEHDLLKVALLAVPEHLKVDDLHQRPLITLDASELGSVALELMIRNQIRHIPVTGAEGRLLGVVSFADLVAADVTRRSVPLDTIRSETVFTALSSTSLTVCAARMLEAHVGCLPVIEDGRATGIVTRRDLIEASATELEAQRALEPASHK